MAKIYSCGIDPGLHGLLALLSKDERGVITIEKTLAMPLYQGKIDIEALAQVMADWKYDYGTYIVTIERQLAFKQGAVSSFTMGLGVGVLMGICATLAIPYKVINCGDWQTMYKKMKVPIPTDIDSLNIKTSKKISLATAQHLFPNTPITTNRGRYRDELSDALLIARWALQG